MRAAEKTAQKEYEEFIDRLRGLRGRDDRHFLLLLAAYGVIGISEVILSDFARLEADTRAAAKTAQREYGEFLTDSVGYAVETIGTSSSPRTASSASSR